MFGEQPIRADLTPIKRAAIETKAIMFEIYQGMSYKKPGDWTAEDKKTHDFLLRARYQSDLSWLCYVNKDNPERLTTLLAKAKQLHANYQKIRAQKARGVCNDMNEKYARIPRDISWMEIKGIANSVRRAKETLELEIRDDVELMELAFNHTRYIDRESSQMLQEILAVDSKLQYIKDHFDARTQPYTSAAYIEMIRAKWSKFSTPHAIGKELLLNKCLSKLKKCFLIWLWVNKRPIVTTKTCIIRC